MNSLELRVEHRAHQVQIRQRVYSRSSDISSSSLLPSKERKERLTNSTKLVELGLLERIWVRLQVLDSSCDKNVRWSRRSAQLPSFLPPAFSPVPVPSVLSCCSASIR
jgi:hypothetical protein